MRTTYVFTSAADLLCCACALGCCLYTLLSKGRRLPKAALAVLAAVTVGTTGYIHTVYAMWIFNTMMYFDSFFSPYNRDGLLLMVAMTGAFLITLFAWIAIFLYLGLGRTKERRP